MKKTDNSINHTYENNMKMKFQTKHINIVATYIAQLTLMENSYVTNEMHLRLGKFVVIIIHK